MIMRKDMVPTEEGDRYKCPFYGFYGCSDMKIFNEAQGDNLCGLSMCDKHGCGMESKGESPDWEACGFNDERNSEDLEEIVSTFTVYLAEGSSMPFVEWYEKIMGERELGDYEEE